MDPSNGCCMHVIRFFLTCYRITQKNLTWTAAPFMIQLVFLLLVSWLAATAANVNNGHDATPCACIMESSWRKVLDNCKRSAQLQWQLFANFAHICASIQSGSKEDQTAARSGSTGLEIKSIHPTTPLHSIVRRSVAITMEMSVPNDDTNSKIWHGVES